MGDDYYVNSTFDIVIEAEAEGPADFLFTIASYTLGEDVEIETMSAQEGFGDIDLTGNALLAQGLIGNSDDNVLDGGGNDGFADELEGKAGNDTYVLGTETSDTIEDLSGTDTITSTISRNLQLRRHRKPDAARHKRHQWHRHPFGQHVARQQQQEHAPGSGW